MGLRSLIGRAIEKRGNPLESPAVSLASPAIWQWLAGGEPTAAGELINEMTAMQQTTVYTCARVLGESVASLPLRTYERLPNGRQEALGSDLYALLTLNPNPEMTAFTFFDSLTGCLALTGNCYAQIQRNAAGQPIALWPLHPLKTSPIRVNQDLAKKLPGTMVGDLAYETTDGTPDGKPRYIPAFDVLHVPLFCFDGLKGFSPIQMARQGIGLARAAEKFGARFFGNGARPGGVLSTTQNLTDVQKQQIRESWNAAQGGANQGKTAVVWGDWKYTQIGLSPEDSQFLATRQFLRTEIAGLFRVPPHMVGDTSRLSNGNHEQQSLSFVTDVLRPYLCRFEQEIHRKLMPTAGRNSGRYFVQFDVRERLRGDFQTTMQGYALGKQWGWYNSNRILEELGDNPIGPTGDIYWMPLNMQDASLPLKASIVVPNNEERSTLGQYTASYIRLFRDGVGRLSTRNKRDLEAIASIFGPILECVAEQSESRCGRQFDLETGWNQARERIVREACKSIEKRAAHWSAEKADELAGEELSRAVRSIVANIYREAAAITALKGLSDEEAA